MASKISIVDDNDAFLGTSGNPVNVVSSAQAGLAWTLTTVTMDGASKQLLAANANRKGLIIHNRTGNDTIAYHLGGGTAVLLSGLPLPAGYQVVLTRPECPVGAVTAIGTNTNVVNVWEGV